MRPKDIARRLLRIYDATTPSQQAQGSRWYEDAKAFADALERKHALVPGAGAGIIAALSPRMRWETNMDMARRLAAGIPAGGLGRSLAKAQAIREGTKPTLVLGGPKVRAFHACIRRPQNRFAVCIDVWAARAAGVRQKTLTPPRYRAVADGYRIAAEARNIAPPTFQAIVWVAIKEAPSRI